MGRRQEDVGDKKRSDGEGEECSKAYVLKDYESEKEHDSRRLASDGGKAEDGRRAVPHACEQP